MAMLSRKDRRRPWCGANAGEIDNAAALPDSTKSDKESRRTFVGADQPRSPLVASRIMTSSCMIERPNPAASVSPGRTRVSEGITMLRAPQTWAAPTRRMNSSRIVEDLVRAYATRDKLGSRRAAC